MPNVFPPPSVTVASLSLYVVLLAAKHVLCDFPLQSPWMALRKDQATGWAKPLFAHCLIHGLATTALVLALTPGLWFLGLVDFAIHVLIDRGKGMITSRKNLTPDDRPFWLVLGVDQALHHLTGFGLAVAMALYA